MKTIIHVILTDEERGKLATNAFGRNAKKMVSRAEVNDIVQEHVKGLLSGKPVPIPARVSANDAGIEDAPQIRHDSVSITPTEQEPTQSAKSKYLGDFVPSNGDESYLAPRDSDTELKKVCKEILRFIDAGYDSVEAIKGMIQATGIKSG